MISRTPKVLFSHDRVVLLHGDSAMLGDVLSPESVDSIVTDPPAGIGFMGKGWDSDKGGRDEWIEWLATTLAPSYRALKPGGHIVSWAIPRTSHWTAMALEKVGFEIRDVITWVYGSGFPKSLDVSKAIDATLGAERPVIGRRTDGVGNSPSSIHYDEGFAASRETSFDVTAPASTEAKAWSGWGTALKPAAEHWILARKPLTTSVARNVMTYGTGALNVDGCRIGTEEMPKTKSDGTKRASAQSSWGSNFNTNRVDAGTAVGRWPANFGLEHEHGCVDDACTESCPVLALDVQGGRDETTVGGSGVSRFFFTAKPAGREKDAGLRAQGLAEKAADAEKAAPLTAAESRDTKRRNIHPTVKPIELMRWLVRLVTPPGGVVLDPFAGSGTTGVAALAEGMSFVGCELGGDDGAYLPIIEGRLRNALGLTAEDA